MMKLLRSIIIVTAAVLAVSVVPESAFAGDKSFSTVVKHIESNYNAKRRGIPMLGLARFAVKLIKPAGVKNFKVVMLENLDFSNRPSGIEFHPFVRAAIDSSWHPVAQYSSRPKEQWAYI